MENLKHLTERVCRAASTLSGWIVAYRTRVAVILTLLFFAISFVTTPSNNTVKRESGKLEKRIGNRQKILERYVAEVMEHPVDQWVDIEDFPDDMVIYKYNADTIQCWLNEFPINNDEVDVVPLWYRLHYLNSRSLFNTPLAYLTENEQYVNLGSAWYVVKVYVKERVKVIAGLLIKTEYLSDNAVLVSKLNPAFGIDRKLHLAPVNFDDGFVVKGKDGGVLFSVIDDVASARYADNSGFRWLSLLFAFIALFFYFMDKRSVTSFLLYWAGMTLLWVSCYIWGGYMVLEKELFSPNLYADSGIFSSLGNLLLNNLYVFLLVMGIYMVRRRIIRYFHGRDGWLKSSVQILFILILPLLIAIYIHLTLLSLIKNSNIVMEIYRIEELDIYSVLCYISYGLLFIALLLQFQTGLSITRYYGRISLLKVKYQLVYIFIVSIYLLSTVSYLSYQKELARTKMWTNRLSVERDMGLELQLRFMEGKLLNDQVLTNIMQIYDQGVDVSTLLSNRLNESYLQSISQKYEIQLTICRPNESFMRNQRLVDCNSYFQNEVIKYGSPLSDRYVFFFLNNYSGRVNYLGMLTFNFGGEALTLYIELNSRFMKDVIGYPSMLFDYKQADNLNMPGAYSYAKYVGERMIIYRGDYNYPISIDPSQYSEGFSKFKKDGYIHFVNKFSSDSVIVISRPKRDLFIYFVSFSYIVLFFSALFFVFIVARRVSKRVARMNISSKSFRRKVNYLLTFSLVISLLCMGLGSVWYCLHYFNEVNRSQMEEKLLTVQSALLDFCKYIEQYNDLNRPDLYQTMERMAGNVQVDINLYDPHGRLIRSTQPELFERYLLSSRMNGDAYREIIIESKRQVVNREKIAELSYHSLYAPVINNDGKLIAIVNIPYFTRDADISSDISSIIAAIINVYILLLLAAILGGTIISNSVSRPLAEISRKMQRVDISGQAEHINYSNNDELGTLVTAYNKMVDDLEESTKRLAQSEREQAWSEMARQIAHEIKNPLTPMRLSIQHLVRLKQRNVEGWEDKFEEVAGSILEQIDILSDTASEFSSFAKFYYEENSVLNLYNIIVEQKILFDTRESIKILFNYESEEALVYARKGQIIRVFVNLLSNAVQALEALGGGYIRISLARQNGNYVVSVEDNGTGVNEENITKLFKPNFTTKSSGTGLGLAISRNIIEQSGGTIFYHRSELGGANFSFTLPLYRG